MFVHVSILKMYNFLYFLIFYMKFIFCGLKMKGSRGKGAKSITQKHSKISYIQACIDTRDDDKKAVAAGGGGGGGIPPPLL